MSSRTPGHLSPTSVDNHIGTGLGSRADFHLPFSIDEGFGPSRFHPLPTTGGRIVGKRRTEMAVRVSDECPLKPGVYGMLDQNSRLIYVGKSKHLRIRLRSYFADRARRTKAGRIINRTKTLVWETQPNEFAALLRELELIRLHRPVFNVKGQPTGRRPLYLCVGGEPAPYAYLSREPQPKAVATYGPVSGGDQLTEAVRRLNDYFQLRDCRHLDTFHFTDRPSLFPMADRALCLRRDLGTCLGPCVAGATWSTYRAHYQALQAFLAGTSAEPLTDLEVRMRDAAKTRAFERAASLRDWLTHLHWLDQQLAGLRAARANLHAIYPLGGLGSGDPPLWYWLRAGQVIRVTPAPCTAAQAQAILPLFNSDFDSQQLRLGDPAEDTGILYLVYAWFKQHPKERRRCLSPVMVRARLQKLIQDKMARADASGVSSAE